MLACVMPTNNWLTNLLVSFSIPVALPGEKVLYCTDCITLLFSVHGTANQGMIQDIGPNMHDSFTTFSNTEDCFIKAAHIHKHPNSLSLRRPVATVE